MIPRILVPITILPGAVAPADAGKRASTALDSRLLVPQNLPVVELDGHSAIPSHVPLDVLGERVLIPRDMEVTPLALPAREAPPPSRMDSRVAVPPDARPTTLAFSSSLPPEKLAAVGVADVFTTGEVNLMSEPAGEVHSPRGWEAGVSSLLFHAALITLVLLQPKLFPFRSPTEKDSEIAHRNVEMLYVPPGELVPAPPPPQKLHIDPRVFQRIAPPNVEASPNPGVGAPEPSRNLRENDKGGGDTQRTEPPVREVPRQVAKFEPPAKSPPQTHSGLNLRPISPGKLLQQSTQDAARGITTQGMEFSDALPGGPGGGLAGGGQGYAGGAITILTPTEGVDFTNYVARMLASVRRNWMAVIPESARLGEKGIVVLDFDVMRDGSVPPRYPELMRTSGREPLDRAAISAIRASNPFEPLPPAFTGPLVRFRFIFLYNIRPDELK